MKKQLSILFGLAIIICALLACGSTDPSNNSGSVVTPPASTQTTQASASHFKVGQVVKVGDTWEITVNSVKISKGDDIVKPGAGNTFLIVNVTVKNMSNAEQDISSLLNFTLKDADGTQGKISILTSGVTPAPDGKIAAGDKSKGDLVYEVSASQKQFTLAFTSDLLSSGQSIWDIKL